jgi:glycosyltransferase involved in cell wall biosynthesis
MRTRTSLRIALVGTRYYPALGGVELYLRGLAQGLAAAGDSVTVVCRDDDPAVSPADAMRGAAPVAHAVRRDGPVPVVVLGEEGVRRRLIAIAHRLRQARSTQALAALLAVRAFLDPLLAAVPDADVVHFNGTGAELLGFAAAALARRRRARFVVCPHAHVGSWGDGDLDVRLYRAAGATIAKTHYEKEALAAAGVPRDRVHVVGNAPVLAGTPDPAAFRARYGLGAAPVILLLGQRRAGKGHDVLAAAGNAIWQAHPDARIVFAGAALPETDGAASVPGTTDPRLLDVGQLDDDAKASALAACDVFCLPSTAEAFGIAYLEAWSYGKPVIACDTPVSRELIAGGEDGLLVPQTPAAVARAAVTLLSDPTLRARLGRNGQAKTARCYSQSAVTGQTRALYLALLRQIP